MNVGNHVSNYYRIYFRLFKCGEEEKLSVCMNYFKLRITHHKKIYCKTSQ